MVEGDKRDDTSSSAALREQGNVSLQCPKLTETNYTTWALIMETILKAYGIWETIVAEEGETTNEKKDNTSKAIIFQTLPQDMLMQVAQYTTAKEKYNKNKKEESRLIYETDDEPTLLDQQNSNGKVNSRATSSRDFFGRRMERTPVKQRLTKSKNRHASSYNLVDEDDDEVEEPMVWKPSVEKLSFQHSVTVAKGTDPNKPFASRPKPVTECGHNTGHLKNLTKNVP
nr:zinc finger, CCHC-type [Tanacetum cinerariifolium]